jgi:hypothetical protein
MTQQEKAICYAPLFDLIYKEHNRLLTCSEMDEIIRVSLKVVENLNSVNEKP